MTKRHNQRQSSDRSSSAPSLLDFGKRRSRISWISDRTLRTRYRNQLDRDGVAVHHRIVNRLVDLALQDEDKRVSLQAASLWVRARLNWREADAATVQAGAKVEIHQRPVLTARHVRRLRMEPARGGAPRAARLHQHGRAAPSSRSSTGAPVPRRGFKPPRHGSARLSSRATSRNGNDARKSADGSRWSRRWRSGRLDG